ncbi:MAG: LysM peptidoglycan-binding domain-containing protein [Candidatus Daviesbacteria bacterium]|nr:LysM peptidoglycan-binding domain-containing protein [Candidatus Daviesbacteria bacterium]
MPAKKQVVSKGGKKAVSYSLKSSSLSTEVVKKNQSLFQRLQDELNPDRSYVNLVLGLLIVLVLGVLAFNYLKRDRAEVGPSNQTLEEASKTESLEDVSRENLPGKYIVKEGDTLFTIAESYYNDGYKFESIVETNQLDNADNITVGQVLEIPKLEETKIATSEANIDPKVTQIEVQTEVVEDSGTGGAVNQTSWGEKITGGTYTVAEGDWLSTIAGRTYGDVMAFEKIAQANNIVDPNVIYPGTVLKLP